MARIRTIKPEFWLDEDIATLSEPSMLLAIGLLNHADDEGYFNANPGLIKAAVFPLREPSKNIRGMLDELSSMGYIQVKKHDATSKTYGWIVNFKKHQRVDKPRPSEIKELKLFQEASKKRPRKLYEGKERKGKEGNKGNGKFITPIKEEVIKYFVDNGYTKEYGTTAFDYYNEANWKDSNGKQVLAWKQKMQGVWFKDENKSSSEADLKGVI